MECQGRSFTSPGGRHLRRGESWCWGEAGPSIAAGGTAGQCLGGWEADVLLGKGERTGEAGRQVRPRVRGGDVLPLGCQ